MPLGRRRDVVLSDFQLVPEPGMIGIVGLGGVVMMRRGTKLKFGGESANASL
jgi:hypothetical protein